MGEQPTTEKVYPPPPQRGIYATGEDNLRVTSFGGLAGVVLAVEGRFIDCEGFISPLGETHTPNSDRTIHQTLISIAEGTLTDLQVRAASGTPGRGQCYVIVELVRGRLSTVQPLATLIQGYVSSVARLAYPGSPLESNILGRGVLRSILGTDPAAGAELSEVVPAGALWRLIAFRATLVASAAVANRFVTLLIDDGVNEFEASTSLTAQTASQTILYDAGSYGAIGGAGGNRITLPMPGDLWLPAGARIKSITTGLDAGDNWGAPDYLVEELIGG